VCAANRWDFRLHFLPTGEMDCNDRNWRQEKEMKI